MYNRYIPQPDGSFRRNRIQDSVSPAPAESVIMQESIETNDTEASESPQQQNTNSVQQVQQRSFQNHTPHFREPGSVGSFLKNLLPQNFDTEDLIVVLLLLLMSGNKNNDQNAALLTLGIYLFM